MSPAARHGLIRAPGKLVLAGEYAVLDGAPALVLAVDRGVWCRVSPADTREIRVPGDDRFVRAALDRVAAPPARYEFGDWNPVHLSAKAGFGGSAAATVAAVLAGGGRGEEAWEVHAQVQGGGSGVDVAASLQGGLVRFQRRRSHRFLVEQAAPLPSLPLVVHSGEAGATMPRVRAYEAWKEGREAFVQEVAVAVDRFLEDPIAGTRHLRFLTRRMAARAGFLYETPALTRIAEEAEALGGAARPSGAGGGDCALVFLPDPDARRAFRLAMRGLGLSLLPVMDAPAAGWAPTGPASPPLPGDDP